MLVFPDGQGGSCRAERARLRGARALIIYITLYLNIISIRRDSQPELLKIPSFFSFSNTYRAFDASRAHLTSEQEAKVPIHQSFRPKGWPKCKVSEKDLCGGSAWSCSNITLAIFIFHCCFHTTYCRFSLLAVHPSEEILQWTIAAIHAYLTLKS